MLRPLVEFCFRHLPRRAQERYPYTNCQFGDITEPIRQEYVAHVHRCFADLSTRVAFLSLGYDICNAVLPQAGRLAGIAPICWIWGDAGML